MIQKKPILVSAGAALLSGLLSAGLAVAYLLFIYDWDRGAPIGVPLFVTNAAAISAIAAYIARLRVANKPALVIGGVTAFVYMIGFLTLGQLQDENQPQPWINRLLDISFQAVLPSLVVVVFVFVAAVVFLIKDQQSS